MKAYIKMGFIIKLHFTCTYEERTRVERPDPKPLTMSEPKPMVIEISSASDLSDINVASSCPIQEEIESPRVQ